MQQLHQHSNICSDTGLKGSRTKPKEGEDAVGSLEPDTPVHVYNSCKYI